MNGKHTFSGVSVEDFAERYRKIRTIFELGESLGCPNLLGDAIEGDQLNDQRYPWAFGDFQGYTQIIVNGFRCDLYPQMDEALHFDEEGRLILEAYPLQDEYPQNSQMPFILRITPTGEVAEIARG